MSRSNERGVAMIFALFMMLAMSLLGTSLIFVSRTETVSSQNYRMMSQARFGAESAVHKATNYLLTTYQVPRPGGATDPYEAYTQSVNGITWNGAPVVLSSDAALAHYPVPAVQDAFAAFASDTLTSSDGKVEFTATATLKSMQKFKDAMLGTDAVVQTWEIVGDAVVPGANPAHIQVSAVFERQPTPLYQYAAFATSNQCAALSFAGGAVTNSYDSTSALAANGLPSLANNTGNVGTNGNLTEVGNPTTINGSLSTPRSGVGSCTESNVTAQTISGYASVSAGLNQLPQEVIFPTPPTPDPLPPTTNMQFTQNGGCPAGVSYCTVSANGATIHPPANTPVLLGNVVTNGNSVLHLGAGTYVVNSFTMNGSSKIVIDSGPVIFKVAGVGQSTPITITGNGINNPSFKSSDLQFLYGGTGEVKLAGGDQTAGLFYAPNATSSISGGADLYGAIVVRQLTATGGAAIHYDRNLNNGGKTTGNPMMSTFNWSTY